MEIILREAIDTLGQAGDVVRVKNGYARNYLLPRKKAYIATPGNLKVMAQEKARMIRREAAQREEAEKLRGMIEAVDIRVERLAGDEGVLYGSVTNADVAEALEAQGYTVDKRKIQLEEHIKRLGRYTIPIRLFTEVVAEITVHVEAEGGSDGTPEAKESDEAASGETDSDGESG